MDDNFTALTKRALHHSFVDLDYSHHSPSSCNKPAGVDLLQKLGFSQEERRAFYAGPKAHFGNYPGNNHPMHVADKLWGSNSTCIELTDVNRYSWDQMLNEISKDMKEDDIDFTGPDKKSHDHHKKIMKDVVKNWHEAYKKVSLQGEIECEPNVVKNLGTQLDMLGRMDYRGKHAFIEYKTKPPTRYKKKDGTFSFSTKKLPDDVEINHARQTAFYWSTNKDLKPFVIYVNEKEYKIFDPSNSDMLTVTAMEDHLEYYRQQCLIRENLVRASGGDINFLLSLIDPDFEHQFYWNIGEKFVTKAKQAINNALRKESA